MDLTAFADEVGPAGPVAIAGTGTRGGVPEGVRTVAAPAGIEWIQADEMTVCCGAGTHVDELSEALASVGQRSVLPPGGTVGGALAAGHSGIRRLGDGPLRDALLQARYVSAAGEVVKAGGPTVKNVSGFDVCKLLVGSRGTLGFIGEVILRTRPIALHSQWFTAEAADPATTFAALHRPTAVLWDGAAVHVLLEGHPTDVAAQAAAAGLLPAAGAPASPVGARRLVRPAELVAIASRLAPGTFLAEVGLGVLHLVDPAALPAVSRDAAVAAVDARVKSNFDPAGRLNPGVVVG